MAADVKARRMARSTTNMEDAANAARSRAKLSLRYGKADPTQTGRSK